MTKYKIVVICLCVVTALLLLVVSVAVHIYRQQSYYDDLQAQLLSICRTGSAAQLDLSDMVPVCKMVIANAQ